jgi:Spy/CpxP family protein refolding chaperone
MRKGSFAVLVLLLSAALSSGAVAGDGRWDDRDYMMGGGFGMGYNMGMMGFGEGVMGYGLGLMGGGVDMMGPVGPYSMLDLTAEQTTKINKLLDELRKQHLGVLGKMMDEQAKMRDLFYEEKLDTKKIGAVYDAISSLRKQLLVARVDATNSISEILTKEQREELSKRFRGRRGLAGGNPPRGMMGR